MDYQKAPAAASVMHTEALQLLQLDLLGRVEPAAPFKNHESTAIWCQITHPGPATPASPALSTDFQLKISTEKRKKSTLRIHRTPNKGNSSKRLCSFQISTRYASFLKANVRGNSPNQVPKMSARYGSWMFYMTEPGSVSIFRAFP